jgi:hypothetical protein
MSIVLSWMLLTTPLLTPEFTYNEIVYPITIEYIEDRE